MKKFFRGAILGAPGSGKGTISSKIVQRFDIYHVSTGDIFRWSAESEGELGKTLKKYVSEGKLVPDELATKITLKRLHEVSNKNWLLDGFPRTLSQAEKLFVTYPFCMVISLNVPFDIIIERVKDRWIHPASGRIYNTTYKPPKVPGKDDLTGESLIQRSDDSIEALQQRLEQYSELVSPLLEFYKNKKILKEFSGNTSDEIWPKVEKELLNYIRPK